MTDTTPATQAEGLEQLAAALHDAYIEALPARSLKSSEYREGWLAVAQTASDGASIAAKAVTEALGAERDALAAELQGVHGELKANGIEGDPENHWAPLLVSVLARDRDRARRELEQERQELDAHREDAKAARSHLKVVSGDRDRLQAERDKLDASGIRLMGLIEMYVRSLYAVKIDVIRGDTRAVTEALSEGLDGFDGPEWNGTETGQAWLERTHGERAV